MSVFTLQGHMVVFSPKQAAEWEVGEIESGYLPNMAAMHLLFGPNLSPTLRCPPFVSSSFPSERKVVKLPVLSHVIFEVKKSRAERVCAARASECFQATESHT